MSLPDLLQWAGRGQKSGTLELRQDALKKRVHFRSGSIAGSSSNDPRDYLGQVLLSEGVISEQQLKDAMELQGRTKVMLGRILVQWGLVEEPRMAAVLRHKAEETIYSLFLWDDAEFEFRDGDLPPGDLVAIEVAVEEVLMEGVRRYDTSRKIRELLPHNRIVLGRAAKPLPADMAAKAFPRRIHDLIDGRRTIGELILEAHASEFNVCQVLYVFVQRGHAEIVDGREAVAGGAGAPRAAAAPAAVAAPALAAGPVLASVRALLDRGDAEEALEQLDGLRGGGQAGPEMNALTQVAESMFVERAYRHYLPPSKVPILRRALPTLVGENLSPAEVFLVSRVNGSWDLRSIMSISPLREVDALRALKRLRERGVIDLVEAPAQARTA